MANRQSPLRDAARLGEWNLRDVGKELRVSRITSGATQAQVAAVLGISRSHVSRVENGLINGIGIPDISRHAAAVGLKPWVRLYPTVTRPMDKAQLTLFGASANGFTLVAGARRGADAPGR